MAIEKELLQAINLMSQGKEEGFNSFYSHTYNFVYSRAKLVMKNEEDALDLTQETFIQAYKGIGSLDDANNVYAWLGSIVYRQGMRIFRKKKEVLVNDEGETIFEDVASQDISGNPEDAAQQKATAEIVMGMIEELPELQKAAVLAFYYDNMKIEDIARISECSANTIKSRLNYAKKFLKDKVEAHEKANRYKLHSLSPVVLFLAFKSLFTTDGYSMAEASAQSVYNTSCSAVGLSAGTLTLSGAGSAGVAATGAGATMGTSVAAGAATSTGAAGVAAGAVQAGVTLATKAGLTLGAKIGITIASILTTGAVVTGIALYVNHTKEDAASHNIEASMDDESEADSSADSIMDLLQGDETESPDTGATPETDAEVNTEAEPDISFVDYAIDWKDSNLEIAMQEITGIYNRDIMYSDIKDLTTLVLSAKGISDISALGCLTELTDLRLAENNISDISVLTNLTKLEYIALESNYAITDISALANLTNLYSLSISHNQISDISPLANLTNLSTLTLNHNSIQDVSPLENLTDLILLRLDSNIITDVSALANLTNLRYLLLSDNQITDISPLSNLTKLSKLEIRNNYIADYSPVSFVPELYY